MGSDTDVYRVLHFDESSETDGLGNLVSEDYDDVEIDGVSDYEEALSHAKEGNYDAIISGDTGSIDSQEFIETTAGEYGMPIVWYGSEVDSDEFYQEFIDEPIVDFVPRENMFDDFDALRASVVRTVEYNRRTEEVDYFRERAHDIVKNLRHDVCNPLNVANGQAEILQDRVDLDEIPIDINILSQLERIEELVNDANELAAGVDIEESDMEKVNLDEAAREAYEHLSIEEYPEVEPTLDIRNMGRIEADESRLKNMLTNLFCNSINHGDREDLEIEVGELKSLATSTRAPTAPKGIYVEDNGVGLPDEEEIDIFKQGETTSEENTGYGLPTVKEIAEAHGWELDTGESRSGGARFEFTFR